VGIAVGYLWDLWFPINKNLWTSSYVIFTAGAALVVLSLLYWVIDVKGHRKWARPLVAFGVNAISAFFLSGIVARLLVNTRVTVADGTVSLKTWLFDNYFATWAPPNIASLAFALAFLTALWLLVELLYRKRIFIKV
jgi:predicted acyltransferase